LLHEKPFAGINGSGKHNNWSMATNTGVNLLSPGKNPKTNLQFLTFLVNVIKAVNDSNDVLRASVMNETNSYRLGGHEAPPAIISVFVGTYLTNMLDNIARKVTDKKMTPAQKTELKLGIGKIPEILLDNTDRNRTSPFAFTGNRFEFRAVGSSANCRRKYRKHAIVVIFIIAAIITPPDVFSQTLVAIPLLILYEVSILISSRVMKQKEKDRTEFFDEDKKTETVTT
jgi:glutamine synthetase type III